MEDMKGITIKTSRGLEKWSAIDFIIKYGQKYYLMENDKYGDEVPCIILNSKMEVQEWDWYDTLLDWINEW